jgi:hypothetical protein
MRLVTIALIATVMLAGTASMAQAAPTSSAPQLKPPVAPALVRLKPPASSALAQVKPSAAPSIAQLRTACGVATTGVVKIGPLGSC